MAIKALRDRKHSASLNCMCVDDNLCHRTPTVEQKLPGECVLLIGFIAKINELIDSQSMYLTDVHECNGSTCVCCFRVEVPFCSF